MSEPDKAKIVGGLTIEAAELRKSSAFIRKELELAVDALDAFTQSLRPRTHIASMTHVKPNTQEYATKYSDISKLLALVKEQDDIADRAEAVRKQLSELGV